jgi:Tol biopolymer transport system component
MSSLALLCVLVLAPQGDKVSFDEKVLATIPEGVLAKDVTFFKDGRQVAYRAIANGKMHVVVNGAKQPEYANIADGIAFSPAGKIAYRATNGSQWFVVIGGAPGPGLQSVGVPVFSPDGSKFAYEGSRGIGARTDATAATVYVNHAKEADWAATGAPAFSGDGSIVAHSVRIGKAGTATVAFRTAEAMVIGGKSGTEYDEVSKPWFAPKGKMMAYRFRNEYTWTMVVDGKPQDSASDMGEAVFSPDGKGIAYRSGERGKYYVVINGKKSPTYPEIGEVEWSPDNKTVAFTVRDATQGEYIVYGDRKTEVFSRLYSPVFSSDGLHMAFGARSTNGKYMVVLDDKNGPAEFEAIGPIVISPDGKSVAFAGQWNFRWTCAINSGRASMNDFVRDPVWSPDSKKVAYVGQNQGKWFVEVNYRRGEDYDEVLTAPVFSADSKKCAYGVRRGPDLLWKVVPVVSE